MKQKGEGNMSEKVTIHYPEYYSKFACIGSRCEDTCCANWQISADPASLNRIVVFHPMDAAMGERIAKKKLGELGYMLAQKKVELEILPEAMALLAKKGTSTEYGAREMDRIIGGEIKPLLVDELLFGSLKKGGVCRLGCNGETFVVEKKKADVKKSARRRHAEIEKSTENTEENF